MSEVNENLDEVLQEEMDDATVITVQIDNTLTQEGSAADAKAVGEALAGKADLSAIVGIDVNGEAADEQGHIILTGESIPLDDDENADSVTDAIEELQNRTGADIPLTADENADTIAEAVADLQGQNATTLKMSSEEDAQTIAAKIAEMETAQQGCVKSVNGEVADANGAVTLTEVPLAQNLTSDQSQATAGYFLLRTTGGSRSIGNGTAQLQEIRGAMIHTGEVAENIEMTVSNSDLTVTMDHDAFVEAMTESGTITFTYTTEWDEDPTDYGLTITGTPENGDTITIVYVAGNRGTITPATPTAFKATGWNLYNSATEYARVVGYNGRYHVGGTYTALQYSATLNGERGTITPDESSSFTVPGDGYVWVTGGSATDTYITPEWTDWTAGPNVAFEAYTEMAISLSSVMSSYFPNGLLAVGTVYDSISIDQGRAISRIERIAYDPDDLADIIAQGRAYEADENYIYVVRTTQVSNTISVNGQFTASDHGIEMVEGTEVATYVVITYGQNLKAKLVNDVVTLSQQTLTDTQKSQVLENLGMSFLSKFVYSGTLANGTDLNNVGTPGHYLLSISYSYSNKPTDAAFLIVERSASAATTIFQLCYGVTMCAFRFRTSATSWSYWQFVTLEAKNGSYSLGGCMANGYVSNSNVTDMYLEVPLYKKLPAGKTLTLTSLKMEVRGDQGYVDIFTFANGDVEKKGMTGYTYSLSRTASGNLYITLTKSAGLTNVTNNTPVLAKIRSIKFTVS